MKLLLFDASKKKQSIFKRHIKNETKIKLRNFSPKIENVAKCHIEWRRKKIANV